MDRWLEYANDSLEAFRRQHPARVSAASYGLPEVDQLSVVNVATQLKRLMAQPILTAALAAGTLHITGIFFDSSTGQLFGVDHEGIVPPDDLKFVEDELPEERTRQSAAPR